MRFRMCGASPHADVCQQPSLLTAPGCSNGVRKVRLALQECRVYGKVVSLPIRLDGVLGMDESIKAAAPCPAACHVLHITASRVSGPNLES
jgi:hypothetical protein